MPPRYQKERSMAKENGTAVVAFDMNRLGMDDLEDFVDAARGNKFRDAAAVMAKCCTRCPEAWGAASLLETGKSGQPRRYIVRHHLRRCLIFRCFNQKATSMFGRMLSAR